MKYLSFCIFDVPNHYIKKKFQECHNVYFPSTFRLITQI